MALGDRVAGTGQSGPEGGSRAAIILIGLGFCEYCTLGRAQGRSCSDKIPVEPPLCLKQVLLLVLVDMTRLSYGV